MTPRIEFLSSKKLIGNHLRMSVAANKTVELFRGFMPQLKGIKNRVGSDIWDIQIYDEEFDMKNYTLQTEFEKWAAVEVSEFENIPEGLNPYTLRGGLYAVFIHKGLSANAEKTFRYIFTEWLPNSVYELDSREHFEIMGSKYKANDPESEEEIWIPVKTNK